CMHGLEFPYSF
nr:immunoglobulin light chain junction region [Macaca mulatta]MOX56340.1 immunoglobulin light chain junction region [Macaca mulatta]